MAWASTHKVVLGCIAFIVFWILAVFPAVPFLPIGRTAGSLLGASLMVVFQVISPNQAFDAIDLPILGLLFGTMVVSVYLERADLFKYLGKALAWRSRGPKDLLCRICLLSAISSALFTNDTTCVIFTEFVLKLCKQHNVPALPFLMALASSSNIGSAATAIGNPQNLVIAVQSKISFFKFLVGVLPAMVVGILFNTILLLLFYWKSLRPATATETGPSKAEQLNDVENPKAPEVIVNQGIMKRDKPTEEEKISSSVRVLPVAFSSPAAFLENTSDLKTSTNLSAMFDSGDTEDHQGDWAHTPADLDDLLHLEHRQGSQRCSRSSSKRDTISRSCSIDRSSNLSVVNDQEHETPANLSRRSRLRRKVWKTCVYLVTLVMLAALLYGLNLSWSAMTAAVALIVLDFSDAGPCLDQVSYSLLVFFSGMFITVDGFNRTGAPGELWKSVEPHARIDSTGGIALLSLVVILLSNVASNVPTVLLLGARVAASAAATKGASVTKAWLMLAWVSTVAGNLTLVGSAANLIVSEQARRAESGKFNLSFWKHLVFGVPSTLIVIAVGLPLIQG